jgi:predicted Mrr-cat superfamily restriction endonuclease
VPTSTLAARQSGAKPVIDTQRTVWGIHAGRPHAQSDTVHRDLEQEIDQLFREGTIAIGWPYMGDLQDLGCDMDAFKRRLEETNKDLTPRSVAADAGILLSFACAVRIGDLLVWRPRLREEVRIGRILSDYRFEPESHDEYVHRRTVRWARNLRPSDFTDEARRSLGQQKSFFQITNHRDDFIVLVDPDHAQPTADG